MHDNLQKVSETNGNLQKKKKKKKKMKMCGNRDGRRWYSAYSCVLLLFGGGRVRGPVKNMVQFILMNQYYYDSYP